MARARNYRIATGTSVTMVDTEAFEMDDQQKRLRLAGGVPEAL
jgi:hypothetical protein